MEVPIALQPGHHGVVVVHGVGRQHKGETLAEVAEALALTLEETAQADFVIQREMDIAGPVATATLRIGDGLGNFATWTNHARLRDDASRVRRSVGGEHAPFASATGRRHRLGGDGRHRLCER